MLGSLMMLASGVCASFSRWVNSSGIFWSFRRHSGKLAMIRPASEMSAVSISTPVPLQYARRMGSSAYDASAGASSVLVHVSFMYWSQCE